jgi:molybdopterin adenylyltransferase
MRYIAAILTVSDSVSNGTRKDLSGPAVATALVTHGFELIRNAVVPDEKEQIEAMLVRLSEEVRLVVTTGGTGLAIRDVTPEATRAVCDRLIEGLAERMRSEGMKKTPLAALSRAVCGVRGRSIIVNVPGSPKAAVESFEAIVELLPHALELLAGNTEHRSEHGS